MLSTILDYFFQIFTEFSETLDVISGMIPIKADIANRNEIIKAIFVNANMRSFFFRMVWPNIYLKFFPH
jgi:hypothetical protein